MYEAFIYGVVKKNTIDSKFSIKKKTAKVFLTVFFYHQILLCHIL